jgi:hypothetical protein
MVCLNEKCVQKVNLCATCVIVSHKSCDPTFIMEVTELHKRVKFPVPSFPAHLKTGQLKAVVARELKLLGQVLEGIIDEFDRLLQKEYEFLEKVAGNSAFFASNIEHLTISAKAPDQIRAVLAHEQKVEEFVADIYPVFSRAFWWAFRKTTTDYWVQQLPLISTFRSETVDRSRSLLNDICRFDFYVLTSIALYNYQLGFKLRLEDVLLQMVEMMKISDNPFELLEAEGLLPGEVVSIRDAFWEALFQAPEPTFVGLQKFLTDSIGRMFLGQKTTVRFNKRGMFLQGPRNKKYAMFEFLDYVYFVAFA